MLTGYEAQKLQNDVRRELSAETRSALKVAAALKCAVLLFLLFGIAWIGADSNGTAGRDSPPGPLASAKGERYSRTVFEERKRRHIETHPDLNAAREVAAQRQGEANSGRRFSCASC